MGWVMVNRVVTRKTKRLEMKMKMKTRHEKEDMEKGIRRGVN